MAAIDLSNFLSARAKALKLPATIVSQRAGISRQTWYRLVNAEITHIRLETLERVADVLQVSLVDLAHLYIKQQKLRNNALVSKVHIYDTYPFVRRIRPLDALINEDEIFEYQWKIINSSHHYWVNRRLICVDEKFHVRQKNRDGSLCTGRHYGGLEPQQNAINLPLTAPNEQVTVSVRFRASREPGTVISFWKMVNAKNENCFPEYAGLSCQVRIIENSVGFDETIMEGI